MMKNNLPLSDILPSGVCSFEELKNDLLPCRALSRIPENAKSVIVYLFPYYLGEEYYEKSNISKYSVPDDYHLIVPKYLNEAVCELKKEYPDNIFEAFCDNSPIKEVKAAVFSGLGVKGENGLLINEIYGSYCFIGEIVTDKVFEYSPKNMNSCLKCGECRNACPGKTVKNGFVDKRNCLSDITQKKGELSAEDVEMIRKNGCIWGCDICQNVCPMNNGIKVSPVKEFYETAKPFFKVGDTIENRAFSWRGEKVINRNLEIMCCKDEKNKL